MGWRETLGLGSNARVVSEAADPGSVALSEVLDKYELIDVITDSQHPFAIVADRGRQQFAQPVAGARDISRDLAMAELGVASPSPWTSWTRQEHVPELRDQQGLRKYLEMKRSDATIRASLRLFKTPIVSARWFVEAAGESGKDVTAAKWLADMFEFRMRPWEETLNEILLMCDYGHSVFEKVFWEVNGRLEWKRLAPRHPLDIQEWLWDANGGPAGVRMYSEGSTEGIIIPIEKLLVFTFDIEGGDVRGMSLLRSAYKHWYYRENLFKIDAIQKERHGIGIPIIKLPVNFSASDKAAAENLGRNLRTNERAHVVLPPNWDLIFAKLEGQPVNALESVSSHESSIWRNILAPFVDKGEMKDTDQSLFMKSTRYVANSIAATVTHYGFAQLIALNHTYAPLTPHLRARRIGEWDDLRTLSFALRNLIGADIIRPDDVLEKTMREEFDLPPADPETARAGQAPQNPNADSGQPGQPGPPPPGQPGAPENAPQPPGLPDVGPPRQSTAQNMQVVSGQQNRGNDRSGKSGQR